MNHVAIKLRKPVCFFSLEMSAAQLELRQKSTLSGLHHTRIKAGDLSDSDIELLEYHTEVISSAPIYIDETASLTIHELRQRAMKMKYKYGIELIIVDYLQLMRGERDNGREREISSISNGLKQIAKELNLPVLALSQLNRAVESRTDKTPQLSDLRESGAIEQDADVVLFLWDNQNPKLKIGKNRRGKIGPIDFWSNNEKTKFADREPHFVNEKQMTPINQQLQVEPF
jgi:replicative DNA helicase